MASIEALQADPNVDMVLVQEALPREPGSDRAEHYIRLADDYAATKAKKPIAFVTPISHGQTDYSRALRAKAPHVSFLQEANKALRAIASVARREERERLARDRAGMRAAPAPEQRDARSSDLRARATAEPVALDEAQSKEVLRAYGIATAGGGAGDVAAEARSRPPSASAIRSCSRRCRRRSLHKSDVGAVALDLATPAATDRRLRAHGAAAASEHASPACWSASRSAAGSSSCSACIAIPKWAWW